MQFPLTRKERMKNAFKRNPFDIDFFYVFSLTVNFMYCEDG